MKKVFIFVTAIICLLSMSIILEAANTGDVTLVTSSATVQAGTEFSITVSATDSNNLNTVEYSGITITNANGDVTSAITVKSIEAASELWAKMANESNTAFVYSGTATQSSEVFKINLTVNDTITEGEYKINIEGLKVYSANIEDDTTTIGTKTISIKAIVDTTTAGNVDDNSQQNTEAENVNTTPSTTNTNNNNSSSNTNSTNTTKKKTTLPQTGVEMTTFFAIVALGIVAIGSYVSYKKYKEI